MYKRYAKVRAPKIAFPRLLNTAAYARVSSRKDEMLHSLAAQVSYYSEKIQTTPGWVYAGVYADDPHTGTKDDRPEFQRMLADCRAGKIDILLVKSISRFARNAVTLLETVRELKRLGVDIFFETENIHTMSDEGELQLSLIAAVAQEQSRTVSENCKWRIQRQFREGEPVSLRLYGYILTGTGLKIVEDEACVVREIFDMALSGLGKRSIARRLTELGINPPCGSIWQESTVMYILQSEKIHRRNALAKDVCRGLYD